MKFLMDENTMLIFFGCGQVKQNETDPLAALSPMQLIESAANEAIQDCGVGKTLIKF